MTPIAPTTDPVFSFEDAYELGLIDEGLSIEQAVGGTDEGDVYVFSVGEPGRYTFTLDGLSADADLALLSSDGEVIDFPQENGSQSETIEQDLAEGEYFLAVRSYDNEQTDYLVDISSDQTLAAPNGDIITPSIDPGEELETAFDLGVVSTTITIEDSVYSTDEDMGDVYEFTVEEAGEYTFNLDNFTTDLGFLIVDSEDIGADGLPTETVVGSNNPSTEPESASAELDPGVYYATVISLDDTETPSDYSFSFGTGNAAETGVEITTPPSDPGSTINDTFDVGSISGTFGVAESVGTVGLVEDETDVYAFTVDEAGEYSITLDGLSAKADLFLVDDEDILALSESPGIEIDEIAEELDPGTYYVGVVATGDLATDYVLTFSDGTTATPDDSDNSTDSADSGDTFDTATSIGEFSATTGGNFSETIGGIDTFDVFEFSVAETEEFNAVLTSLDADVDLGLFDSEGELVLSSATEGTVDEEITGSIEAGTYFLGVVSFDGEETSYDLTISGSDAGTSSFSVTTDEIATTVEDYSIV